MKCIYLKYQSLSFRNTSLHLVVFNNEVWYYEYQGGNLMDDIYQLEVLANESAFELIQVPAQKKISQDDQMTIQNIWNHYLKDPSSCLLSLGSIKHGKWMTPSLTYIIELCHYFYDTVRKIPQLELQRGHLNIEFEEEELSILVLRKPYMLGEEYILEDYIAGFFNILLKQLNKEMNVYSGSVEEYFLEHIQKEPVGRIFFHLVENPNSETPFAFLATYSHILDNGKIQQIPLINALDEYRQDRDTLIQLLSTVNKARQKSHFINELSESGELFHPLQLDSQEAYTFLKEIPIYEECGIVCRVPKWFIHKQSHVGISTTVGDQVKSILGMNSLLDFHANIVVDGEILSMEEIQDLIDKQEGLALIKGKWVEVNADDLQKVLETYRNIQSQLKNGLTLKEALRLQLDNQKDETKIVSVENGQWLNQIMQNLINPQFNPNLDLHIQANLRPYQSTGVSWLSYMQDLGFGACLADDMGLGKTLQIIALLSETRNQDKKALLIVPASLLNNWANEIKQFAPEMSFYILHPSMKKKDVHEQDIIDQHQLIITTYSMCGKYQKLVEYDWDILILDEAQAIKNPNTKQTKTIKQFHAKYRVALTGTPIENKLMDLWSLFDFLNSGLLGTIKEFKSFVKELQAEENTEGYAKLRTMTAPFLLRRLKTDRSIISDLPDKIEMKTYTSLSKTQIALYEDFVSSLKVKLMESEGIQRKGLVLASLLKLKQICNHPDEYLGNNLYDEKESGKFLRLREICEEIYAKHERVLIFTQFKEMVEPINDYLETVFHIRGVSIDGSTSLKKRKEAVELFQSDEYIPYMVLSIKAGGVGLNLTKANHVIHFDRWWNPAVENQATDRAFRIGQKKNVIVHKFICEGTIEEKIDQLIEDKVKLSEDIISQKDETWITEMNNDELLKLFDLEVR